MHLARSTRYLYGYPDSQHFPFSPPFWREEEKVPVANKNVFTVISLTKNNSKSQFYLNVTLFQLFINTINCLFQQDCFLLLFFSASSHSLSYNLILENERKEACTRFSVKMVVWIHNDHVNCFAKKIKRGYS